MTKNLMFIFVQFIKVITCAILQIILYINITLKITIIEFQRVPVDFPSNISYEHMLLLNKSYLSDYGSYLPYDYENMYDPLSPSYIPEIHPSNLSFVTPLPSESTLYSNLYSSKLDTNTQHQLGNDQVTGSFGANTTLSYSDLSLDHTSYLNPTKEPYYDDTIGDCPFIDHESQVRGLKAGAYWLYSGSILLLLACNIIFLIWIMKV